MTESAAHSAPPHPVPASAPTARQEQGARSREDILDAAERLMAARGYAGTSIAILSRESGLPASSIYWHFGSKAGVLAAVLERGARRFLTPGGPVPVGRAPDRPRDDLGELLRRSAAVLLAHPRFLRLYLMLLTGDEGDPAQRAIAARVRAEGVRRLRSELERVYACWGDDVARRVGAALCDVAVALFDGIVIAHQAAGPVTGEPPPGGSPDGPGTPDTVLLDRCATALHGLAEAVRAASVGRPGGAAPHAADPPAP